MKTRNFKSRINFRMLALAVLVLFVSIPVVTALRNTVMESVSETYNYEALDPQDKSLAGTYPQWWFLSPDPNALPRQDYRVAAIIGVPVLDVGDPIELSNPFGTGVIPGYITGFDFQSGGYGTLINPPAPMHNIYALVSWTEGNTPFLFIRQSGQSIEQGVGYNNAAMTEVYVYGTTTEADGYGNYHTVALLRLTVPDPSLPVDSIYLLQQFSKNTVLWLLSAD